MITTSNGIRVVRYVHRGNDLVDIDTLAPEEKARAATEIALTYLNELYRGKAVFETESCSPSNDERRNDNDE